MFRRRLSYILCIGIIFSTSVGYASAKRKLRIGPECAGGVVHHSLTPAERFTILQHTEIKIFKGDDFDHADANLRYRISPDPEIYELMTAFRANKRAAKKADALDDSALFSAAILSREQEGKLFAHISYLRYFAKSRIDALSNIREGNVSAADVSDIESALERFEEVRGFIVVANVRLAKSLAKKADGTHDEDLFSELYTALFPCVDAFDYRTGNKFSTYSTWGLRRHRTRVWEGRVKNWERFPQPGIEDFFDLQPDLVTVAAERDSKGLKSVVLEMLPALSEREAEVMRRRFGLIDGEAPQTLEEVGRVLGVCKERIRQIEVKAKAKLRDLVASEHPELVSRFLEQ